MHLIAVGEAKGLASSRLGTTHAPYRIGLIAARSNTPSATFANSLPRFLVRLSDGAHPVEGRASAGGRSARTEALALLSLVDDRLPKRRR